MISAFTAQPLVELKQRDKSKIEAILSYGNRLLVGLNTGNLRIYRINEEKNGVDERNDTPEAEATVLRPAQLPSAELLREIERFSRRAIEQLAIIKEANLLVCLSDGQVTIHDLQNQDYQQQESLSKTKGASVFAVTSNIFKDQSTGIPSIVSRLAVAVKRKLLLWSWHDTELSANAVELTLSAAARTLTWANGTKLLCGLNSGYVVVDVELQVISDVIGPGSLGASAGQDDGRFGAIGAAGMGYMGMGSWVPRPLATKLTEGEMLLAKDVNTLFIDGDGKALNRRQIQWSTAPESISFSYPYLLALQGPAKGLLEVRNPRTLSLLQSISLPNATYLHVPQPNVSLAHAGKGFLVASGRCVWRMKAENYESQIDQLLEKGQLDEAISLLEMLEDALLEDKAAKLREVKMQKAETLFHNRRYRASVDLFTEVAAPPERVIRLYPPVVAGHITAYAGSKECTNELDPKSSDVEADKQTPSSTHAMKDEDGDVAASKKSRFNGITKNMVGFSNFKRRSSIVNNSDASSAPGDNLEAVHNDISPDDKDVKSAILELYAFLADTRRRLQSYINPDGSLKELVHKNLAEQAEYKSSILRKFLIDPESFADRDLEQTLRDVAKLVDTTLFRAYLVERPARAGSLLRIPNYCDPEVVNEKLLGTGRYEDLVDFFNGKKLHRLALKLLKKFGQTDRTEDIPPALRGAKKTVAYLQTLPPEQIDLILEFARWPLTEDPQLGMEIFLADTENAETLPRDRILRYLQDIDPKFAVKYLEHLVEELNDLTPEFHQQLVNLYVERLKWRDAAGVMGNWTFQTTSDRAEWIGKLQSFLRSSRQYSTGKTFNLLPKEDPEFYEARAIVLSKMGNHRQALEIYVFKLQNHEKAEEYCNYIYVTQESQVPAIGTNQARIFDEETSKSIYQTLLSLYLRPPPPHQPDWNSALNILSKHGSRLPASSTLDLMPPSLPIQKLESYFRGRLRTGATTVNESRVMRGLCVSEHERARATIFLGDDLPGGNAGRNRKVVISEERVCRVCHKRLGRSVVSIFADNSVVHYGCANRVQRDYDNPMSLEKR